ncbi:unnamed protein product [Soboliphyme baturini]|uniref:DUF862 domain-containing protein n=1 Tax=Soboliphyme baturini TaxID=241478 RepID=A0A183IMJ8_9BILA|nr:unnamed protein product [Soboliphyme baturini]
MARYPVYLNVYDMYWVNDYLSNLGIGVYHTGVEVHDWEYGYGGHPLSFSGVFQIVPKDGEELGENYRFKQSILLGYTELSAEDVSIIVQGMGDEFKGDRYHLLTNNCNHFSAKLSEILCGQTIPSWVNRLAYLSTIIPFLERCLPREWLTPIALQQSLDRRRVNAGLRTNCQDTEGIGSTERITSTTNPMANSPSPSLRSLFHFASGR